LTHPHILPLLDSGELLGRPFYVMPFIEGPSLQTRLKQERPMRIGESIRIGCEIADALNYAHAAGVVHRDIKPANVLMSGTHALVADFGASHLLGAIADDATITQQGLTIGTPLYMSPEQAAGEMDIDGRSDIYSLGCLLHEMLSGQPPFVGRSTMETIALRFLQKPRPIRALRNDVPDYVETALLQALSREPADRFRTAAEFEAALSGNEVTASGAASAIDADGHEPPSLAVVPFANLDADKLGDYFTSGLAEDVAKVLARIRNLRVVPPAAGALGLGSVGETGRRLRVDTVLEGSVKETGDRLRVTATLSRTIDASSFWRGEYVQTRTELLGLHERIARDAAGALKVNLIGQALAPITAPVGSSQEAHDLYLRARYAWNKRTEDQLERSVRFFNQAIEREPSFARAYSGLSDTLITLALYGVRAPGEAIALAKAASDKALQIDPTLADAHASLGCALSIYDWKWKEAETEFQRSLVLDPGYATAPHWYAVNLLGPLGRFDEALAQLARAQSIDALSPSIAVSVGVVLYAARRFQESVIMHEKALEAEPHFFPAHHFLGQSLLQLGEETRAIDSFERALHLSNRSVEVISSLAHARGVTGDVTAAEQLLAELNQLATRRFVSPYLFAQVFAGLGRYDAALQSLERAIAVRATEVLWLPWRAVFDPVRNTAQFGQILQLLRQGVGQSS
jgi:serine/threonine-protein kinase